MDLNLFASIPPPPPTFYQVYYIPSPTTQIQTLLRPTPFECTTSDFVDLRMSDFNHSSSLALALLGDNLKMQLLIPFLILMKSWCGGTTKLSTSSDHFKYISYILSCSSLETHILMSFLMDSTSLFSFCRSHLLYLKAEPGSFLKSLAHLMY